MTPRLLAAALLLLAGAAQAGSLPPRGCDRRVDVSAAQQDRLLRFAAVVQDELQRSGREVALVARSGTNLERFGLRYSHAGISLKASGNGPWSVRQLYYACEEGRPRLFDQGIAGFVFGTDDPAIGYFSAVLLPEGAGRALERSALDAPRANRLLAATYSANAYAFSTRYQNCNQWVAELMASAWGPLDDAGVLREQAQGWLARAGYAPPPVEVGSRWLMLAAAVIPWVRVDDHPEADRIAMHFRTSVPTALEAFVRAREPQAERLEFCHAPGRVVVRRGWEPIGDGCVPRDGDRVVALD